MEYIEFLRNKMAISHQTGFLLIRKKFPRHYTLIKRYRSLGGCRWMPCYILQLRYAKDSHPAGNTSGNLEP